MIARPSSTIQISMKQYIKQFLVSFLRGVLFWQNLWWDFWSKWSPGVLRKRVKSLKKSLQKLTHLSTNNDKIIVYHLFGIPNYFQSLLEKVNNALCFLQVFCLMSLGEQQKEESAIWIYLELSPKELSSLFFSNKLSSACKISKSSKLRPSLAAAQALAVLFLLVRVTAARARRTGQRLKLIWHDKAPATTIP